MTTAQQVTDTLLELLGEVRPEADYEASQDFLEDGLMDSFDIVTLVADLEESFDILIDGLDIVPEHFLNLEALRSLLRKNGVDA